MNDDTELPPRTTIPLRQFAYCVAGPREVVMVSVINGVIAWWLFGHRESVPLVGSGSVMSMLVPMSYLLPGFSTFFGVLTAVLGRKALRIAPPLDRNTSWVPLAMRVCLTRAAMGGGLAFLAAWTLQSLHIELTWSGPVVVAGITVLSGALAFWVHTSAVLATRRLDLPE